MDCASLWVGHSPRCFTKLLIPLAANVYLGIVIMFTYIDGSSMPGSHPISLSEPGMLVYRNFKQDTLRKKLPEFLEAHCFWPDVCLMGLGVLLCFVAPTHVLMMDASATGC